MYYIDLRIYSKGIKYKHLIIGLDFNSMGRFYERIIVDTFEEWDKLTDEIIDAGENDFKLIGGGELKDSH